MLTFMFDRTLFESEKFCLLAAVSMSYISYPKSKVVGANLVHYTYNTMSSQKIQWKIDPKQQLF